MVTTLIEPAGRAVRESTREVRTPGRTTNEAVAVTQPVGADRVTINSNAADAGVGSTFEVDVLADWARA
jgi:hypothetical protein